MAVDRTPDDALTLSDLRRIRGADLKPVPIPPKDARQGYRIRTCEKGSRSQYNKGCRCVNCKRAMRDYARKRKQRAAQR